MIVLTGPTAVGKTRLSIALAKAVGGEILSADSMQVYRHMDIGSAKATWEEMQGVPHHMIDILEPWEPFSAALFQEYGKRIAGEIHSRGHIPIVTGGTGFYIQALLRDIDFSGGQAGSEGEKKEQAEKSGDGKETIREEGLEQEKETVRERLERLAREKGPLYLHELLRQADPASAEAIHANNIKRTIRALVFYEQTGQRISEHNEREKQKESAYRSCYFVLNEERDRLYARIERRVDEMLAAGLVDEVRALRGMGCDRSMISMQGLGYKEILAWLEGEYSYEEAVEILKRDTRRFAKRQLTWFRRERDVIWVNKSEFDYDEGKMLDFMLDRLRERGVVPPA
ncbi:MAG: tRNA (adenosine(37)-N6)-dimethylallyltransferase MiaA [Roseburia sp.]|nr:tRNA (adenosine(37)-N6)-dimethylallyltransferase MiaA [Roseburia sp.]MCM1098063.1 tRNA (adenosine(37)-N6)-dimethylallyltransferase MiaA [Ruminococcus flavefaciens]